MHSEQLVLILTVHHRGGYTGTSRVKTTIKHPITRIQASFLFGRGEEYLIHRIKAIVTGESIHYHAIKETHRRILRVSSVMGVVVEEDSDERAGACLAFNIETFKGTWVLDRLSIPERSIH